MKKFKKNDEMAGSSTVLGDPEMPYVQCRDFRTNFEVVFRVMKLSNKFNIKCVSS